MDSKDIRWKQRFENYKKALTKLTTAIDVIKKQDQILQNSDIDELTREGLIQRFEYTQELAWNVMKDYAMYQGNFEITGSRDAIRYAFSVGLIADKTWLNTISDRNRTSHVYDEEVALEIMNTIISKYYPLFVAFYEKMSELESCNTD